MFQKTMILGRLGRDAELKQYNGQDCVQFTVAVDNGYYDQAGNWIDRVNWYRCSIWRKVKIDRLKKGASVFATGVLSAQLYRRQDGSNAISLDIKVDDYRIVNKANEESPEPSQTQSQTNFSQMAPPRTNTTVAEDLGEQEDDLPF